MLERGWGKAHRFSLTFQVPDRLFPQICDQMSNSENLHNALRTN